MSIKYSPLCDKSEFAYFLYCFSNYGSGVDVVGKECGGRDFKRLDGGDCGVGSYAELASRFDSAPWASWLAVASLRDSFARGDGTGGCRVEIGSERQSGVGGVSSGRVGDCGGRDVGSDGDDVTQRNAKNTKELSDVQVVVGGPNVERNRRWRKQRQQLKQSRKASGCTSAANWRERSVVGDKKEDSVVRQSLEDMWTVENKVKTLKLREELKRLEARAVRPRPSIVEEPIVKRVKTHEELVAESLERAERLKQKTKKHIADQAYWEKRAQSGAVDKAIALENEILDGQLSGKYDPFASRRTLGWAKTVKTHSSGSGSGSSGSLNKTVWSGSGATSKTDLSVLEQKVAVYEEKLKKAEKEVVDVNKKADALNKQLITVTVESERKDKELLEVKKFKEYLEKAKREKKRRADNEFEAFRTQADCSY